MLPVLRFVATHNASTYRDIVNAMAEEFTLSEEERHVLLPSGTQRAFDNRVGWATTYLKNAGLISSPKRAHFIIEPTGAELVLNPPSRIDVAFLRRYPSFISFISGKKSSTQENNVITPTSIEETITPDEQITHGFSQLNQQLSEELQSAIQNMSWQFFEQLVVDLIVKMGYGGSTIDAGTALKKSGDEGIDGIIKEDPLGLDTIYIQAKRWKKEAIVGRPEIQKFCGALMGQRSRKGIFITTSDFSREARDYVVGLEFKIVLINGDNLTQLMIANNIGCRIRQTYDLKELDISYFEE